MLYKFSFHCSSFFFRSYVKRTQINRRIVQYVFFLVLYCIARSYKASFNCKMQKSAPIIEPGDVDPLIKKAGDIPYEEEISTIKESSFFEILQSTTSSTLYNVHNIIQFVKKRSTLKFSVLLFYRVKQKKYVMFFGCERC